MADLSRRRLLQASMLASGAMLLPVSHAGRMGGGVR